MPIDEITQQVSDRYTRAASTGEQMCCPTSYDMADLKSLIPEEVLNISYGCGTPAGLKTVSQVMGSGFLGIHLIKSSPWQVIDGIHFFSVTLTGYKLPPTAPASHVRHATLRGPFSRVVDELGTTYLRGIPKSIAPDTVSLLSKTPLASHFVLSSDPLWLDRADDRWVAVYPADSPCHWQGYFAMFAGPFVEAADDDHHVYRRGEPVEICSKTLTVLKTDGYAPHFAIINRARQNVTGEAVTCSPDQGTCC